MDDHFEWVETNKHLVLEHDSDEALVYVTLGAKSVDDAEMGDAKANISVTGAKLLASKELVVRYKAMVDQSILRLGVV